MRAVIVFPLARRIIIRISQSSHAPGRTIEICPFISLPLHTNVGGGAYFLQSGGVRFLCGKTRFCRRPTSALSGEVFFTCGPFLVITMPVWVFTIVMPPPLRISIPIDHPRFHMTLNTSRYRIAWLAPSPDTNFCSRCRHTFWQSRQGSDDHGT